MAGYVNFYIVIVCVSGFFASGGQGHTGFKLGESAKVYALESKVLLNDVGSLDNNSVGYLVSADVHVGAVWEDQKGDKLLKFKFDSLKLHIKSRKAPSPEGFVEHASSLDSIENGASYALWRRGEIEKVFFSQMEPTSLVNFKKGVISLFQFQVLDMEKNETDVSGYCSVLYTSTSPSTFTKTKRNCVIPTSTQNNHPERILSVAAKSNRVTKYFMSEDISVLETVLSTETHEMKLVIKQDAGNSINVVQRLVLYDDKKGEVKTVKGETVKAVIAELVDKGTNLKEQGLQTMKEPPQCQDDCPKLGKLVKDSRELLKSSTLGTIKSATIFLKMLTVARQAKTDEIYNALKGVKNKEILQHLSDLVGFTQTVAAHQAAKKFFHFDSDYDVDNTERYLWALSIGTHPQEEVIYDILKLSENTNLPAKLTETLILTVSAMANKFAQQSQYGFRNKVVEKVMNSITFYFSSCTDNDCRVKYIRAFKNLQHPDTVKILLKEAQDGQRTVSVTALKALRAMPKSYWNAEVLKICLQIFYQLPKRYDSSSRSLAVDIILESGPSEDVIRELLTFLTRQEKEYEVKQFLYQRLLMIADQCPKFRNTLGNIITGNKQLNNWHVLGQRGLTTAFSRSFMQNQWANGSLVTIQEISGGLLKRGHVDVVIESEGDRKELFSLGLFAGGLSSAMGGSSVVEEGEEEEAATAGMELSVQGVQVRPFTFFTSQGELLSHLWAGTASSRTTAFQSVSLLNDYSEWITLGNGVTAELSLLGAVSFDLAGQIQVSLWSRVAHSLVEKNAGIVVQGLLRADNSFVKSQVEFVLTTEPKLNLLSDLDFYNTNSLCMQLKQPDTIFKHNIYKIERIPGSKHKLRKSQYKTVRVPGRTYALNRKNNEMCNVLHK